MHAENRMREMESKLAAAVNSFTSNAAQPENTESTQVHSNQISILERRLQKTQETLKAEQQKCFAQDEKIDSLKRSLDLALVRAKDAERFREREAERLCLEVACKEAHKKVTQLECENKKLNEQRKAVNGLEGRLEQANGEIIHLNSELLACKSELESFKRREEESSEFTRRLTERNAVLQTEHLALLARLEEVQLRLNSIEQLHNDKASFLVDIAVDASNSDADTLLADQAVKLNEMDGQLTLAHEQIAAFQEVESRLRKRLKEERELSKAMQLKSMARIRELSKELTKASRPVQQNHRQQNTETSLTFLDDKEPNGLVDSELPSVIQPVSSSENISMQHLDTCSWKQYQLGESTEYPEGKSDSSFIQITDLPRDCKQFSALLLKMNRLHRVHLKLTDKLVFLEDHCRNLAEELTRKNDVIQHLLMHEKQSGSPATKSVDVNTEKISRTGRIMASLYANHASPPKDSADAGVCLEISQKLQNVFEDCLLKNITLKNNLSTLGLEVLSLNQLNKEIRNRLCSTCTDATKELRAVVHSAFPSQL